MTKQHIFNKVAKHLLTQQKRSISENVCRYKSPEGLRCAVGCLIPDKMYHPSMEGADVVSVLFACPKLEKLLGHDNLKLLDQLQTLHDSEEVKNWPNKLRVLASFYGLKVTKGVEELMVKAQEG